MNLTKQGIKLVSFMCSDSISHKLQYILIGDFLFCASVFDNSIIYCYDIMVIRKCLRLAYIMYKNVNWEINMETSWCGKSVIHFYKKQNIRNIFIVFKNFNMIQIILELI